jgi:hypothetical protein
MLILAAIRLGISNGASYRQERLAANTATVAEQLANNFKIAFIEGERGNI